MAKKIAKPQAQKITAVPSASKLYACCSKPECKRLQETVDFLKLWGIGHKPQRDGKRWYFDLSIPTHWNESRIRTFSEGLAKQPAGH